MTDKPSSNVVAVNYSCSFGPFGSRLVEVARDGTSSLLVSYNSDDKPEIGIWQRAIAASKLDELLRRLDASGYDQSVGHRPFPGGAHLGVRRVGEQFPVMREVVFDTPELRHVMDCLSEIMAELRQHPMQVLQARARWKDSAPARDGKLDIEVVLTNTGTRPFSISHPKYPGSANDVQLVLSRPTGEEGVEAILQADLPLIEGKRKTPDLKLARGESIAVLVHTKLVAAAVRYPAILRVRIVGASAHGVESVEGTLQLDPGPVPVGP